MFMNSYLGIPSMLEIFSIESENLSKVQKALIGLRNLKLLIWKYFCFNLEHKLELPLEY